MARPRDFLRKFLPSRDRDLHQGLTTRRAALGAADLECALRTDRRPRQGMFNVQVVARKFLGKCDPMAADFLRELLGLPLNCRRFGNVLGNAIWNVVGKALSEPVCLRNVVGKALRTSKNATGSGLSFSEKLAQE